MNEQGTDHWERIADKLLDFFLVLKHEAVTTTTTTEVRPQLIFGLVIAKSQKMLFKNKT